MVEAGKNDNRVRLYGMGIGRSRWTKRRSARGHRIAGLFADERGAEQMEYLLILAAVVLPLVVASRLLWAVLLRYFSVEALILDLPLF